MAEAEQLVADAEALDYLPTLAEALYLQASLIETTVGPGEALPIARRALAGATESGHRQEATRALILIAWIEGTGRADHELGLWLLDQAEADTRAQDNQPHLMLQILSNRAAIRYGSGDYDGALAQFEQASSFAKQVLGPEHIRVADLRFNIAALRHMLGRFDLAAEGFRESLAFYTKLMGPDHPEVAQCHSNLAATLAALERFDEAQHHAQRAIEIWEADGGHAQLPAAYENLGHVALGQGDHREALRLFETARAMKGEILGLDHPETIFSVANVANAMTLQERYDDARELYLDGIARLSEATSEAHPQALELRPFLGSNELARGDYAAAMVEVEAVERIAETAQGEREHHMAAAMLLRARVEHARGQTAAARAALERAQGMFEPGADQELQLAVEKLRTELVGD